MQPEPTQSRGNLRMIGCLSALDFDMAKAKKSRIIGSHTAPNPQFLLTGASKHRLRHTHLPGPSSRPVSGSADDCDPLAFDMDVVNDEPDSVHDQTTTDGTDGTGLKIKQKARRYLNSDAPLLTWRDQFREQYLEQVLALEGRGRLWNNCSVCGLEPAMLRCRDCSGMHSMCRGCAVQLHRTNPLHILEEWKKGHFHRVSLKDLGLRFQLGHVAGQFCPCVQRPTDFVVIAGNGIHDVRVNFCGCPGHPELYVQLLEMRWWPSTPLAPQTVATMEVLRTFHVLNLQARVPPTDFYRGLERMTDGQGLMQLPDRLAQFMIIVREWRHIKMAKRAGRGHDPAGISGTGQGGLSIACRACPHPGINLPTGWEGAPSGTRWLYSRILAEDANFKQKAKLRSNDKKDPVLGPGWATFVNNQAYMEYLSTSTREDEVSHCVGFSAIWKANTKRAKGLRATGIGSVICARHEFFLPNGMGDLQKGERYANMDFIFLSSIVGITLMSIVISYDIACQWSRNFFTRMAQMPSWLQLPKTLQLQFRVPKFHLPGHVKKCWAPYSFNFTKGVGRTDGEGVERNWSWLNGIARCVSMMGPGGRADTLDDFCNYNNWRKTVNLGDQLLRKLTLAIPEAMLHFRAFRAFTEGLQVEHGDDLIEWERQVQEWELDNSQPCPYDLPEEKITLASVRKKLAEEEHEKATSGGGDLATLEFTASDFIIAGIELEEQQQVLAVDVRKQSPTTVQATNVQKRRTLLFKRVQKFLDAQRIFMPGLHAYLSLQTSPKRVLSTSRPEDIELYLPSLIPSAQREYVCTPGLADIEDRLRFAQASESLSNLRRQLRMRTMASDFKDKTAASQRTYTRSRALQDQVESRIRACKSQYNVARAAVLSLRGPGDWERTLQFLKPEDVRGINERSMTEEEREQHKLTRQMAGLTEDEVMDELEHPPVVPVNLTLALGEGRRTLSWIWYSVSDGELQGNSKEVLASLRVEWVKARARSERWREDIILIEEEMRRSLEYCSWRSCWWMTIANQRTNVANYLAEGLYAYAVEQSQAENQRVLRWASQWAAIRARAQFILDSQFSGVETQTPLPQLVVELDDEDETDNEDELDDDDEA